MATTSATAAKESSKAVEGGSAVAVAVTIASNAIQSVPIQFGEVEVDVALSENGSDAEIRHMIYDTASAILPNLNVVRY